MTGTPWDPEADYLQAVADAEQGNAARRVAEQRRQAAQTTQARRYVEDRAWWQERRARALAAQVAALSDRLDTLDPPPEPEAIAAVSTSAAAAQPDTGEPPGPTITREPGGAAWLINRWRSRGWRT